MSHTPSGPGAARRALVLAFTLVPATASAQQFQYQAGLIPGTANWSEGVECADVDNDGDLDVLVADGEGFSSAGAKRQNVLLINQFVPSGTLSFADESTARLGVHASNAKGVTTCDVNGDGWVDVLFCNAFDTDTPFLYVNQGASNPGHFTLESATRGFTANLSSGGGQFGDIDDDGDPDLVLCDAYLGSGSRRPHVFFNDGSGVFVDTPAAISAAATKSAQMDVQLVDIDGDWDLDLVGFNRASNGGTNHYLMLNDGTGTFTNAPLSIPSNSGATYEGEVGDLDGDDDMDMFLVSSSSFSEGAIRNDFAPGGPLGLTQMPALADSNDDNEIALFDWDVDGDYDALVGSLSGSRETMWRNNGALSFTNVSVSTISAFTDSTLDCTVADLDNDGRYEIVTVQGESGAAQWASKVYKNSGAVDTLAPVVVATDALDVPSTSGPFKLHAKIRDQVLDDGVNYVTGAARYVVLASAPATHAVTLQTGGPSPAALSIAAGERVSWTNALGVAQTVQLTSAPYDYVAGVIAPAASAQIALVHPGVYGYSVSPDGSSGTITVTGSEASVAATYSGGQMYRFLMTDTAAGAGLEIAYELEFRDWAGNTRVTPVATSSLFVCNVSTYCTAKINSNFCVPAIAASGTPSGSAGSGFVISATNLINQKSGLFFYGVSGQQASPFQGGIMCVAAPRLRTPVTNSGGSPSGSDCSGVLTCDFNAYVSGTTPISFAPGQQVDGQFWSRDPADAFTTNTTDAIHFSLCN